MFKQGKKAFLVYPSYICIPNVENSNFAMATEREMTNAHAERLIHPVELSSKNIPPNMTPSSMPASWNPVFVMSAPASVGFLRTPKWNCPCPLTSLETASVTASRGAVPVEKKTCVVLAHDLSEAKCT